jgi:Na+-transporting NADH:ubiquinone oxidoreductase subunit A
MAKGLKFIILEKKLRFILTLAVAGASYNISFAQSEFSSNTVIYTILGVAVLAGVFALLSLTDNLIKVEAQKLGVDVEKKDMGLFPKLFDAISGKSKNFVGVDSGYHKLKAGYDLKLTGEASKTFSNPQVSRFSVSPYDFKDISPIPKVLVNEGDSIKAGDTLFFDKKVPDIMYTSPVSGEVISIERGDKRSIKRIVILADKDQKFKTFDVSDNTAMGIKKVLSESGAYALINQRPFDVVPNNDSVPRDIFITTFDSAPLAPDTGFIVAGQEANFQKGIDVLSKLTPGKVYIGLDGRSPENSSSAFKNANNVSKHWFVGKHPSGNVGVQIHHISPIKPGQSVWTLGVQDVITIGKLFNQGIFDCSRVVAVAGSRVTKPTYAKTMIGANIGELLKGNLTEGEKKYRIIDGDVLSGAAKSEEEFLGFKSDQVSVISEGDDYELFGWLLPIKPRPSISGTFPTFLYPDQFEGETNTHGERRAFVVSGQYEEVLPMNIYPQHLAKAIMAGDIEKMEGLGINELSEEDLALCEFVCTSKVPMQSILREGLNLLKSQG